jgi:ribosomal protein S27AE
MRPKIRAHFFISRRVIKRGKKAEPVPVGQKKVFNLILSIVNWKSKESDKPEMFNQFCRACGNEVISSGHLPLDYCTNCGARLSPQTQNYAPPYPTTPFRPRGAAKLTGKEKLLFGFLISIPIVLILAGIVAIALFVSAVSRKQKEITRSYPTPRNTSAPQKPSNLLLTIGKEGLGNGEFKNAESVAVDKNGNIYVGDGTLRIQKFDREGKFLQLWNVTEGSVKADEKYTSGINNLAVDSKNRLYVVAGHKDLLRYDAGNGKFIDKIPLYGEKWMNTPQEATIQDIVMLNDDRLAVFATSFPEGEYVMMVSPEGKPEIKYKDLLKKQISNMPAIMRGTMLVNVTGDIFLMNGLATEKQYLYRYKADGSYVDRFTWDGAPTLGTFGNKVIALNSKGEIYAYNSAKSQISVLTVEGVLLRNFPLKPDSFNRMILDAADNIFIVSRNRVEKFSASGS